MAYAPPARHLLRAKDLADARYAEKLDVDDMAEAAGLSSAHFSREFRRAFGESPHVYLLTRRLERAAALLRTTDRSIADICFSVGLQSLGSFTTSFTRHVREVPRGVSRLVPARGLAGRRAVLRRARLRPAAAPARRARLTTEHIWRRQQRAPRASLRAMKIATTQVWVNDQDEALAFYTEKLGMEVRADVTMPEMGNFRWLTVSPPDQEDVAIVLMAIPGAPVFDEETARADPRADGQGLRRHGLPHDRRRPRRLRGD